MTATTPPPVADLAALASLGTMPALLRQLQGLGGCTHPIRLDGHRTDIHATTGEILRHLKSADLPAGHLLVRCNNRRATDARPAPRPTAATPTT